MPTVSTTAVRSDDVTLVELCVTAAKPHHVRLGVRCAGPVWPPREPVGPSWQPDGVTLEVPAGTTGLGFATSVAPGSVDVDVEAAEPIDDGVPEGVAGWLDRIRDRVATAERLAAADDLRAATDEVATAGGLAAVERLAGDLSRDRRLLERVSLAPEELRERVDSVRVPVESLRTIAQSRSS